MPRPAHIRAPETFKIISKINEILISLGITREGFVGMLNEYLPALRQLKSNHGGVVQINRWLNPTKTEWSEPKAEIILAMKKFVDKHTKTVDS